MAVEFAPDKLIVPLFINFTLVLSRVTSFSWAIATCPADVPVIVLLLLFSIVELEISSLLYASVGSSKFISWFNFNSLKYSINVL